MRTFSLTSSLFLACCLAPAARAQYYDYPQRPQAPDACGPGFYSTGPCGMVYGPGYCLRPCYPPFQGFLLGPKAGMSAGAMAPNAAGMGPGGMGCMPNGPCNPLGSPVFPSHPWCRSPRDFFMYYERGLAGEGPRDYFMR